ncbi:phage tail assembly protein [Roseinatronobacter sp. NSM]|uniref:phage tail assembly protein n=1 Tax=Roseinatronobacter sp. NSM TaxID=3457785 RepID=UPI0040367CED
MTAARMNSVALSTPIKGTDGKVITEIEVMKPTAGALRGLQLAMVQMQDVNALAKLLPRITQPALSTDQVWDLDPADLADLANRVSLFFMTPEQLVMIQIEHQTG